MHLSDPGIVLEPGMEIPPIVIIRIDLGLGGRVDIVIELVGRVELVIIGIAEIGVGLVMEDQPLYQRDIGVESADNAKVLVIIIINIIGYVNEHVVIPAEGELKNIIIN